VFSLRNWAKLRGDVLTTEQVRQYVSCHTQLMLRLQVYIHGKVCSAVVSRSSFT
jgi:hypothetical protein